MHESKLHSENSFITLTYDDDHVPADMSLDYSVFQLFMKRLRFKFRDRRIRFYMCGEYGEDFSRPHFHACLFGIDFPDKFAIRAPASGAKLFRSPLLESLWPYGFSSVGEVTFESAAYCARYIMKKITGDAAESHYTSLDLSTGEIISRTPEFCHMSLKPGIGSGWYYRFKSDFFPRDYTIVRNRKVRPPKYYDRLLRKDDPDAFEAILFKRELDARDRVEDNTVARLEVRETVAKARLSSITRKL